MKITPTKRLCLKQQAPEIKLGRIIVQSRYNKTTYWRSNTVASNDTIIVRGFMAIVSRLYRNYQRHAKYGFPKFLTWRADKNVKYVNVVESRCRSMDWSIILHSFSISLISMHSGIRLKHMTLLDPTVVKLPQHFPTILLTCNRVQRGMP